MGEQRLTLRRWRAGSGPRRPGGRAVSVGRGGSSGRRDGAVRRSRGADGSGFGQRPPERRGEAEQGDGRRAKSRSWRRSTSWTGEVRLASPETPAAGCRPVTWDPGGSRLGPGWGIRGRGWGGEPTRRTQGGRGLEGESRLPEGPQVSGWRPAAQ